MTSNEKCEACGRELVRTGRRGRPRRFCPAADCQREAAARRQARHFEGRFADDWAALEAAMSPPSRRRKEEP